MPPKYIQTDMKNQYFKKNMKFLICNILVFIIVGCGQPDNISTKLHEMESVPITLDYSSMTCWLNDSLLTERPWESKEGMKLVVFTDSSYCSECNIKKMHLWNKIIDIEKKYDGLDLIFILGVKYGTTSYISNQLYKSGINHPIYLDETQSMLTLNPHIPKESIFHTFLLDKNNNIILVGSPAHSERIYDLFMKIIEEWNREEK